MLNVVLILWFVNWCWCIGTNCRWTQDNCDNSGLMSWINECYTLQLIMCDDDNVSWMYSKMHFLLWAASISVHWTWRANVGGLRFISSIPTRIEAIITTTFKTDQLLNFLSADWIREEKAHHFGFSSAFSKWRHTTGKFLICDWQIVFIMPLGVPQACALQSDWQV